MLTNEIPSTWLLQSADAFAEFVERSFRLRIGPSPEVAIPPITFSVDMAEDAERLTCALVAAFGNRRRLFQLPTASVLIPFAVYTSWSVLDYCKSLSKRCTGMNDEAEAALLASFPPIFPTLTICPPDPMTVVDSNGIILLWYLPGALSNQRQVFSDSLILNLV